MKTIGPQDDYFEPSKTKFLYLQKWFEIDFV